MSRKFDHTKIIRRIAALGMAACFPAVAFAAEVAKEAADLVPDGIREAGVLRIAMPDQGKPFAYKDGDTLKGMDIGLANAVAETLGLSAKIELVPFDAALTGLQADKFDISYGEFYIRAERLKVANFVTSWQTYSSFLVRGDTTFEPKAITELCGYKVGGMAASVELATLQKAAPTCSADKALEVSAFPSSSNAVLALTSGRIDAVLADRGVAESAIATNPTLKATGELGNGVTAIAIKRGDATKGLAEAVKAALEHLNKAGEYKKILDENGVGYGALDSFDIYGENSTPPVYQ